MPDDDNMRIWSYFLTHDASFKMASKMASKMAEFKMSAPMVELLVENGTSGYFRDFFVDFR